MTHDDSDDGQPEMTGRREYRRGRFVTPAVPSSSQLQDSILRELGKAFTVEVVLHHQAVGRVEVDIQGYGFAIVIVPENDKTRALYAPNFFAWNGRWHITVTCQREETIVRPLNSKTGPAIERVVAFVRDMVELEKTYAKPGPKLRLVKS